MFTTNTDAQFHAHEHEKEFRTVGSLLAHTWKKILLLNHSDLVWNKPQTLIFLLSQLNSNYDRLESSENSSVNIEH